MALFALQAKGVLDGTAHVTLRSLLADRLDANP